MDVKVYKRAQGVKKVRVETKDFIFDVSVCKATGKLVVNKVESPDDGPLMVFPRYSNEIEIL